jgi:hypothetical protein
VIEHNLQVEKIAVEVIKNYEHNNKIHTDKNVKGIIASIKEFGFVNPILIDENNEIIAGHGRLMASQKLGYKEVPIIKLSNLTYEQKIAYRIADNKLPMHSEWNLEDLAHELNYLDSVDFDLSLTGFSDNELSELLIDEDNEDQMANGEEDYIPEPQPDSITKLGDVWILGKHRLMCGDSTSIDDVERIMERKKVDLLFTDPPYNVGFIGRSANFEVIKNDDLEESKFKEFINEFINVIKVLSPEHYYIWCNWKFYGVLQKKLDYKACIVWAKNVFGLGVGYRHQHEFCLFNGTIDKEITNESDLWHIAKDASYTNSNSYPL